ncbi:MAG TPA: L-arabinose isomerase, partial [Saprospiraceae bacterium]|nr:L-arabinose isomerase [Saprospiraceae bacterium]
MFDLNRYEVWFITGSQHLYGEETLKQVATNAQIIVKELNATGKIPVKISILPTVKSPEEVTKVMKEANETDACIGIITWMHTFSPSKMWIKGLRIMQKPILHLHTQFNRDIPYSEIDMDFMNLNQSAHGDREHAHILTKMKISRKIVVGHWQSEHVMNQISLWTRLAIGKDRFSRIKIARFGDNMREVAVTDGDKVAAEIQFGFSVNYFGVADLVKYINNQEEGAIQNLLEVYENTYTLAASLQKNGAHRSSLYEAAKIELGIQSFLEDGGFSGYTNTFEDLAGM